MFYIHNIKREEEDKCRRKEGQKNKTTTNVQLSADGSHNRLILQGRILIEMNELSGRGKDKHKDVLLTKNGARSSVGTFFQILAICFDLSLHSEISM